MHPARAVRVGLPVLARARGLRSSPRRRTGAWHGQVTAEENGGEQDRADPSTAQVDHPVRQNARKVFGAGTVLRGSGGVFGKGGTGDVGRLCPSAGGLYPMIKTKQDPPQDPSWWWRTGHLLDRVFDVVNVVPLLGWLIRIIGR